jgi:hypothetical protein
MRTAMSYALLVGSRWLFAASRQVLLEHMGKARSMKGVIPTAYGKRILLRLIYSYASTVEYSFTITAGTKS